jgi:hypothetical protein
MEKMRTPLMMMAAPGFAGEVNGPWRAGEERACFGRCQENATMLGTDPSFLMMKKTLPIKGFLQ